MKAFIANQLRKDDKLLFHSLIIFVGGTIANVLNYLYQLVMGRLLGPAEFGVLGALFALIYIVTFSFSAIRTVATKFTSDYFAKKEFGKIKSLLASGLSQFLLYGIIGFGIYFFIAPFIASFLKIPDPRLMLWTGLYLLLSLLLPIPTGIMNGMQKFVSLSLFGVLTAFLKLMLGTVLVVMGYGVFGALLGLTLMQFFGLILAILILYPLFFEKRKKIVKKHLFAYTVPVFFGLTLMHLFVNLDILLVKHFFDAASAGNYAAASVLGKIVLFSSGALMMVMFPKVSFSKTSGKETSKLLKSTLFYTGVISFGVVLLYFFVPTFISRILFGSEFIIAHLIGLMGFALALFALSNVLVNYNLAIHKTSFVYGLFPLLFLEVVAIYLFHNTLFEVVQVLFVTNVFIFGYLLLYTRKALGFNVI